MSIYKTLMQGLLLTFVLFVSIQANAETELQGKRQSIPQEGKEYITLMHPVASSPKVVEFFSFYCDSCYQFVENYPVTDAINRILPKGETVTKYHVSMMGPLGNELTEAWAIAMVMDKTHDVGKPLFEAVKNQTLKSAADIQEIFAKAGIDAETYQQVQQSLLVKGAIARQKAAVASFGVKGTPTFYVNGKYQIHNAGIAITTPQAYANNFAEVVHALLEQQ
ncbi:DsbA family protein [Yersinia mollaretii]|uniref:DsbA family protein n=1 Tax=Yersinia mollaretii TaxID=33060 RepID=UPI0011AAB206|nr:DsbA family protein [Yersinia mollaretii]